MLSLDAKEETPGTYKLMPVDLSRVEMLAKQNIGPVCDALLVNYHDTDLSGANGADRFKLVQNCEDLLYHKAEAQEAPTWREEGVNVLSGHHDQIVSDLKATIHMPTIVFGCQMLQVLQQPHNHEAMANIAESAVPVFMFDKFMWWRSGPLFTFEPPFEVIKFDEDPAMKTSITKTKATIGGQDRLDNLANAQRDKPGTKIEYENNDATNGIVLSVTTEKLKKNKGDWRKDCRKFYEAAANSQTNPFRCAKVATPSFHLASLAAALKAKVDDGSVTAGLWLIDYTGTGGDFTLHLNGRPQTDPVAIAVTTA